MVNKSFKDFIKDEDELARWAMGYITPVVLSAYNGLPHASIPDYSNIPVETEKEVSNWRVAEYWTGQVLGKLGVAGLFVPDPIPLADEAVFIGMVALGTYLVSDSGYDPK